MKICFVTDSYPPNIGGAEIVIQNIVEGAAKSGIEVIVITTKAKDNFSFHSKINESRIIRIRVPKYLSRFWFLILSFPRILSNAKDADIIHGTSYGGIIQTYIAARILKKPTVVTVHEFMGSRWKKFAKNLFAGTFYQTAESLFIKLPFSKFAAVSYYTKERLIEAGAPEDKIQVIYNGRSSIEFSDSKSTIEIRKTIGLNADDFVFAAYGRTGLTKGFEFLVEAIPNVLKEIENSKFLLILTKGDKRIWSRVNTAIQKIDKNRVVFFTSLEREKLFEYLSASDVIVIPSLSEGFGYTTIEASMLGKKIIASNVGAIPEVISGYHLLVDPQSPEALIKGCLKAYKQEFQYREPRIFDWDSSINNYIKLYREIIN